MAWLRRSVVIFILSLQIHLFPGFAKTLKITNNCTYEVWPAIMTSSPDKLPNNDSGFLLAKGDTKVVEVQTHLTDWRGSVWGRSLCSINATGYFSCQTGDCGTGIIQCHSATETPDVTTLVKLSIGQSGRSDSYNVSVLDGYNFPIMVAPQVDNGSACPVIGCVLDCPAVLGVLSENDGTIIGCRSQAPGISSMSYIFKIACPRAYINSFDDETFTCDGSLASAYSIVFCPSVTMSSLFSSPVSQAIQPSANPSSQTSNSTTKPIHKQPSRKSKRWRPGALLIAAFSASPVILIIVMLGILVYRRKGRAKRQSNDEMKRYAVSLKYDLSTLRSATQNFAAENKLGEGGFGEVYKGKLENGREIAVKRLSKNSGQGIAEFITEILLVARLNHKNLVELLGYCSTSKESLLVYEYLPNSSLDRFLFDSMKKASLGWQIRYTIIVGIASGLHHLHEESPIKVIHRDLKSSNILLDEAMNPNIADFGLARLFRVDQIQRGTTRIVGTHGYIAPEYAKTGKYSAESDVYSFGVIILEIISGQRHRVFGRQLEEPLLHKAWRLFNEDAAMELIDIDLDNYSHEEVIKCIKIGLLCIQEGPIDRPRITSIVAALSGQAITLPTPKPPHFFGYTDDSDVQLEREMNDARNVYSGTETITNVYSRY